MKEKWVIC